MQRNSAFPQIVLGAGLGGFADGIVLHQILQWHHMLSSTEEHPVTSVGGLEANTLADGLFHLATWIAVLVATTLLVQPIQKRHVQQTRQAALKLAAAEDPNEPAG